MKRISTMKHEVNRFIKRLSSYIRSPIKIFQKSLCFLFKNKAFYLQGQMVINSKSLWYNQEFTLQTGGYFIPNDDIDREIVDLRPWDTTRKDMIILLLRTILINRISGDFAELGIYKGDTAKLIHYYAPDRRLHLFDTFEGFTQNDISEELHQTGMSVSKNLFSNISLEEVRKYISPKNDHVLFYKGYFPESLPKDLDRLSFAFVHLDVDLYNPTLRGLEFFYEKLNTGGILITHDYNAWIGVRKAVDEFFKDKPEILIPMPDKSGSAVIIKQ